MAAQWERVDICRDDKNKAVVNLHGATLQSWIHDGTEMIFVSKNAVFDNKKAVRGGIPVVFPCFGPWDLGPQHGFARISKWQLASGPTKVNGMMRVSLTPGCTHTIFALSRKPLARWSLHHLLKFKANFHVPVISYNIMQKLSTCHNVVVTSICHLY